MRETGELHHEVRRRLLRQRSRVPARLQPSFDALLDRHHFLTADASAFFRPLVQPIVTFPIWVAARPPRPPAPDPVVLDLVESTVMGYLYVRVHDDLLDEGIGELPAAMFLADMFLVRHSGLLARHVSSSRFWSLHQEIAADYADAMLLERELSLPDAEYGPAELDLVLRRSQPLVLAGAALLDLDDRWDDVADLRTFVHHAVRAGQVVDDVIDVERDVRGGNLTWVARRLGGREAPERVVEELLLGGLDELVAVVDHDLDEAAAAARRLSMVAAEDWVERRRHDVHALADHVLRSALLG